MPVPRLEAAMLGGTLIALLGCVVQTDVRSLFVHED
jgi:hypothetical protein